MKKQVFAPGCALLLYKPALAGRLQSFLNAEYGGINQYTYCCCNETQSIEDGTEIINVCSGCDRRFGSYGNSVTTVSLWGLLASSNFPFPDYGGAEITVHDACPTRHKTDVHEAVRTLLEKMNFKIVEAPQSGTQSFCCGDSFYSKAPKEKVIEHMRRRASSMPCEDVAVYCVSCIKSMANGGRRPRYLVDLLYGEETEPQETDPDAWHESLSRFAEAH